MENHWLNPYDNLPRDIDAYGILESYDGTALLLAHMNCGCAGEGARRTQRLLEWLGVEEQTASRWVSRPGIHVEFDKKGNWIMQSLNLTITFSSRREDNPQVLLGQQVFSNQPLRTIYFVNPQYKNDCFLYSALHLCTPVEFTYYYGSHPENHIPYPIIFPSQFLLHRKLRKSVNGGFARIHGDRYDVVCFCDSASIHSFLQNLYRYYFGKDLFCDKKQEGYASELIAQSLGIV